MPKLTEHKDMSPRAKAVVEGIAQARGIGPMARRKGMTEEMYEEFMAVVLAAQKVNKITTGYRLPVDAAFEEK